MKTYIDVDKLNEFLGLEDEKCFKGENIGYGETAIIFTDVTDLCSGETEDEKFMDFCVDAEFGQSFNYQGKTICKVKNSHGDAINIYVDENGEIREY